VSFFSLQRVTAVMIKEFTQLVRDRLTYAMILMIPLIQLLLFGYAVNDTPRHLPTAVLAQENTVFARSLISAVRNSAYFDIVATARSPAELDDMLRRGTVQFAVTIPGDFSRRVIRGDKPQILVDADASDPTASGAAVAALSGLPAQALARDLNGLPAARGTVSAPFQVVIHALYNPDNLSAYNVVPGLLGVILSMTLVMMTALGVTRERERGTMEFLLSTPVEPLEVMVGKLAPYVIVGVLQTITVLVLARILFDVPFQGGWFGLCAGILLFIVGSLALGFLISTVARSQLQAMQLGMFYFLPSILLSGFIFPFRGMPVWAQVIGTAMPVTHFLRIVRGALLKGQTLADAWPSLAALAVIVCAITAVAVGRYQRTLD
jgi:ABC-2 type transport system permease protein